MRQIKYYKIADFVFSLDLPDGVDTTTMLPSFRTFGTCRAEDLLFRFKVNAEVLERPSGLELIEKTESDVGKVSMYRTAAGDWWLEMSYTDIDHYMSVAEDFSSASADIDLDDPDAGMVLCSMLRIMWSQAVLAVERKEASLYRQESAARRNCPSGTVAGESDDLERGSGCVPMHISELLGAASGPCAGEQIV